MPKMPEIMVMYIGEQNKTKKPAVRFSKHHEKQKVKEQNEELYWAGKGRGFALPFRYIGKARKGLEIPIK